jgi:aminopeptidase-like protein
MGGDNQNVDRQMAMLWVLNQADGTNSLVDIATRADISYRVVQEVSEVLMQHDLIKI